MRSFAEIDFAELVDHARARIVGGVVFSAVPVMFSVVFSLFTGSHTHDSFITGVIVSQQYVNDPHQRFRQTIEWQIQRRARAYYTCPPMRVFSGKR